MPKAFWIAYVDYLTNMMVIFMAIAIMVFLVHPKAKQTPNQGRVVITMTWQHNSDSDIDLWVKSPASKTPVGFSHMTGVDCDLVRDDLGRYEDPASDNSEMIICRKTPAGLWIIDTFAYDVYDYKFPVSVTVTVYIFKGTHYHQALRRKLEITRTGQQITAFQFTLTNDLALRDVNHIPYPLYVGLQP